MEGSFSEYLFNVVFYVNDVIWLLGGFLMVFTFLVV